MNKMKTFRELKYGDYIIVKNEPKIVDCNVKINGHHYVKEIIKEDITEQIITPPSEQIALEEIILFHTFDMKTVKDRQRAILTEDLDKSETEFYKIIT